MNKSLTKKKESVSTYTSSIGRKLSNMSKRERKEPKETPL